MAFHAPATTDPSGSLMTSHLPLIGAKDFNNFASPWNEFNTPAQFNVLDPYRGYSQDHYNPQIVFAKMDQVIRTSVTGQIQRDTSQAFYTAVLLPLVPIQGHSVSWSTIHFDDAGAAVSPYESVPRITTTQMSEGSTSIVRRAIGLFTEHSFLSLPEGKQLFQMSLRHVATIVAETMYWDVLRALITANDHHAEIAMSIGGYNDKTVPEILKMEIDNWACLQKDTHGFGHLDDRVCAYHEKMGIRGLDTWIMPQVAKSFLQLLEENTTHDKGGDLAVQNLVQSIGNTYEDSVVPEHVFGKKYKFYFTRTYMVGDKGQAENPMIRDRVIGEYAPMYSSKDLDSPHKYRSSDRDIRIFDEDMDNYVTISLSQALENDPVFREDDVKGELRDPNDFIIEGGGSGFMYKEDSERGGLRSPIECIGEMASVQKSGGRRQALQANSLILMARSVLSSATGHCGADECNNLVRDIKEGLEFVRSANNLSIRSLMNLDRDIDITTIRLATTGTNDDEGQFSFAEFDEASGATLTEPIKNAPNSLAQAFVAGGGALGNPIPIEKFYPYLNNWQGLKYIASRTFSAESVPLKMDVQRKIASFVSAVEKLASHLSSVFTGGHLTNPEYSMPYIPRVSQSSVHPLLSVVPEFAEAYPVWVQRVKTGLDDPNTEFDNTTDLYGKTLGPKLIQLGKIVEKQGSKVVLFGFFSKTNITDTTTTGKVTYNSIITAFIDYLSGIFSDYGPKKTKALIRKAGGGTNLTQINKRDDPLNEFLEKLSVAIDPQDDLDRNIKTSIEDMVESNAFALSNGKSITEELSSQGEDHYNIAGDFNKTAIREKQNLLEIYRTTFTLSRKQLKELLTLTKDSKDNLKITVSLPSTTYNQPASWMEINEYLKEIGDSLDNLNSRDDPFVVDKRDHKRQRLVQRGAVGNFSLSSASSAQPLSNLTSSVNIIFREHMERNALMQNEDFATLWNQVHSMRHAHPVEVMVAYAIMLSPFNREVLRNIIRNNIVCPVNYLIFRPYMRYRMGGGIKMLAGTQTGATFINPKMTNFQSENRAATKTRIDHLSYECASQVTEPRNVYLAHDIICLGTLGGAGSRFYVPSDRNSNDFSAENHRYPRGKSLFAVMIPFEERNHQEVIDASGSFSYYTIQGHRDATDNWGNSHYSTAEVYNSYWLFRGPTERASENIQTLSHYYHPISNRYNTHPKSTVMWRAPFQYYDTKEKKMRLVPGPGHFGKHSYPGCTNLRRGGNQKWQLATTIEAF